MITIEIDGIPSPETLKGIAHAIILWGEDYNKTKVTFSPVYSRFDTFKTVEDFEKHHRLDAHRLIICFDKTPRVAEREDMIGIRKMADILYAQTHLDVGIEIIENHLSIPKV